MVLLKDLKILARYRSEK